MSERIAYAIIGIIALIGLYVIVVALGNIITGAESWTWPFMFK